MLSRRLGNSGRSLDEQNSLRYHRSRRYQFTAFTVDPRCSESACSCLTNEVMVWNEREINRDRYRSAVRQRLEPSLREQRRPTENINHLSEPRQEKRKARRTRPVGMSELWRMRSGLPYFRGLKAASVSVSIIRGGEIYAVIRRARFRSHSFASILQSSVALM